MKQLWHCPICHNGSNRCCYRCENNWDTTPQANSAYLRALLDMKDPAFAARIDALFDLASS